MLESKAETSALIEQITSRLLAYLEMHSEGPVVRLKSPEMLRAIFADIGPSLEVDVDQRPHSSDEVLAAVQAVLDYSVRTNHPRFFNQNFAGADPIAVVGDWLGAALNTTNATYEAAPVFTLMEQALLQKLAHLAGMPDAEGLFGAGGSLSNLLALHLARHNAFPSIKTDGLPHNTKLVAFTSAHAHYSLKKAVSLLGMGSNNLRVVPCNNRGQMDPVELNQMVLNSKASGETPFFVNATAGTTVVSAFDALQELAIVAERHSLWLHVDGCYGASALFSSPHKHLMSGVTRADSLSWNLHKMMGVTQQCSALLVSHPGLLQSCFATGAGYLFQPDKEHASLDSGDRHFQCARRVDVLKLWLTWKYRGDQEWARRVERAVSHAQRFEERLASWGDSFALAYPRSFTNVCFWWLPPSLRGKDVARLNSADRELLHRVAPAIKRRMQEEGTAMLGFQSIDGFPNFFRMICINPAVTDDDLDAVIDLIRRYGDALFGE